MNLLLSLGILIFVASCTTIPVNPKPLGVNETYHLTGGVEEPVYPPESMINCWVQVPHDKLWYPCPQKSDEELGKHGH